MSNRQKWRQINEYTKQDRSPIYKDFKINLHCNHKNNTEIDYFIAGLETEADRATSEKTTKTMHNKYSHIFTGKGCSKIHFYLEVKYEAKPYQALHRHVPNPLY